MSGILKRKAEANDTNHQAKSAKTGTNNDSASQDMVFDELWRMSKVVVFGLPHPDDSENGYQAKLHCKGSLNWETGARGLPLWLLVNKAVYAQALKQLRRHATFACYADVRTYGCIKVSPILYTLLFTEADFHCRYRGGRVLVMREREKLIVPAFMSQFGSTLATLNITTIFLPNAYMGHDFVFVWPRLGDKIFESLQRVNFRLVTMDVPPSYVPLALVSVFRDAYERQVLVHVKGILGNNMQILEHGSLGQGDFVKVFDFRFIKA
ncbi:elastin [Parastagonospora nodorum]|nr:elastin [Parastagonospora nodorum]KAH5527769.1 elastin [Parastagonospora nodorum]